MMWRDGNVRNKETLSDATLTIQAHKYNWLQYFYVFFTLLWILYTHIHTIYSFYPVLAAHKRSHAHTHQHHSFTIKFSCQTCHMNMETRRYVYTYFILGQRIHICTKYELSELQLIRFIFMCPNTHRGYPIKLYKLI